MRANGFPCSPAARPPRRQGEATLVAEAVEHDAAGRAPSDERLVVELVEVEPAFVPEAQVDTEAQTVHLDVDVQIRLAARPQAAFAIEPLERPDRRVVAQPHELRVEQSLDRAAYGVEPPLHAVARDLDHEAIAVSI